MNDKAYKFSTRDSTEFTVEESSGNEDFQIFQVTFSCTDPISDVKYMIPSIIEESPVGPFAACNEKRAIFLVGSSDTVPILAYKGTCVICPYSPSDNGFDIQVSGDIEILQGNIVITGDGEIIIGPESGPGPDPTPLS